MHSKQVISAHHCNYYPLEQFLGFPGGSDGKESACNSRDPGSIPKLGRSPGVGNGYPLPFLPGETHRQEPSRL